MSSTTFTYQALDESGAKVSGAVAASDEREAFSALQARGLSPFKISEKAAAKGGGATLRRRAVNGKDLERYVRQLATLLSANVTILETLTTLAQSAAHPLLADRTQALKRDLRAGRTFSQAFEEHLPELPDYVFRLAELGEKTGALSKALTDAADRMEYEQTMRSEVRSALTYPAFLGVAGTGIVTLMFIFVVPRFANLLGDKIDQAPWLSRTVIRAGLWMQVNWPIALIVAAAIVTGVMLVLRNERLRDNAREQLEKLPLIGRFLRQADVGGWCRTVGVAIVNKAALVDALRLGESGAQSPTFKRNLEIVRKNVRAGRALEDALVDAQHDIDPIVVDLIRTGRSAGALGEMLLFAAGIFEKDAKERAKQLTALTEPIAILGISIIVGGIVLSIVAAMTSLYQFDL